MPTEGRLCWMLLFTVVVLSTSGCTTSTPYIVETKLLPSGQFSSLNPPNVHVRLVTAEESNDIVDFPGKEDQELAAQLDGAGSLVLAPCLLVFFLPEFLNPDNWHFSQDPKIREALEQFPSRLTNGKEEVDVGRN